jgi:hypothetical protein
MSENRGRDLGVQHDDHIWLTVGGEAWAIESISGSIIYLWRGYAPTLEFYLWHGYYPSLEYSVVDMTGFDYDDYCAKAARALEEAK